MSKEAIKKALGMIGDDPGGAAEALEGIKGLDAEAQERVGAAIKALKAKRPDEARGQLLQCLRKLGAAPKGKYPEDYGKRR